MNQSVKLFLHGIKPAILAASVHEDIQCIMAGTSSEQTNLGADLKELVGQNYPSACFEQNKIVLFFQNQRLKELFCQQPYNDYHLGMALGYPDSAVRYYEKREPDSFDFVGLNYHGIKFATHRSLVHDNVKWMNQTYDIPLFLQTGIYVNERHGTGIHRVIPYAYFTKQNQFLQLQ